MLSNATTSSSSAEMSSPRTRSQAWISYKMDKEVKPMALRPHPYEFGLYYDV